MWEDIFQIQKYQTGSNCIYAGWYSDIGMRETQEDTCCVTFHHNVVLATVCDGMGGYECGKLASETTAKLLHEKFVQVSAEDSSFYTNSLDELDAKVYFLKDESHKRLKAGTTIASVMLRNGEISWFSVGDSRIYIIRNDEILQLTRDHNYREMLLDLLQNGSITVEQYENEQAQHSALTSYIGVGGVNLYDISKSPLKLKPQDKILLVTDGFYRTVPIENIPDFLKGNISECMESLLREIQFSEDENRDNTTFILLKYEE